MDFINIESNIENLVSEIPENYLVLLGNLKEAEGGYLHYNSKEVDITTGYGIYRHAHPNAEIFEYIDLKAKDLTSTPSKEWRDKELLEKIDEKIDPKVELYLSYLFYSKYLRPARIDLFVPEMVMVMVNLYTNTPKGAWMSIQEGLRDMSKDGVLPLKLSELSTVDGKYGTKTKNALIAFKNIETETKYEKVLINKLFRKSVLLAMKSYYKDLAVGNPDRFLGFLKGWDNRIEDLEHA